MSEKQDLRWHLRITVLPQCNLRCRYCNPKGVFENSSTTNDDEIIELAQAAVSNGIVRIHWTGGEPCIRDMVSLISRAKDVGMVEQVMTTNGTLKLNQIKNIRKAGLTRVNISLDTLNPDKFKEITEKDEFETVVKWIKTSCREFSSVTKMNIVPMDDTINEVEGFIRFAQQFDGKLQLKFIELCPNNPAFFEGKIFDRVANRAELVKKLEQVGTLSPAEGMGDNPNAEYYIVGNTGVVVILITMPSHNFKCGLSKCRKMRVSPFGLIGSCIQQKGANVRNLSLSEKIEVIKERMILRETYSDEPPVSRCHFRADYGIWRFGSLKECGK